MSLVLSGEANLSKKSVRVVNILRAALGVHSVQDRCKNSTVQTGASIFE